MSRSFQTAFLLPSLVALTFVLIPGNTISGPVYFSYEDDEGTIHFTDEHPEVRYQVREITFQESFRAALRKISKGKLHQLISTYADQFDLEAPLVEAVVKAESEYDPMAVSAKGARGLMQLMPATARSLGVENPHDPEENLRGGVRHLKRLMTTFNGDMDRAIAAYNAGEGAVSKFKGVPPYAETVDYVAKVRKYYREFRERASRSASADAFTRPDTKAIP
ncbi:MAG: lytic transglycosylase domain-containing protein [Pseudomonadota bacterium]